MFSLCFSGVESLSPAETRCGSEHSSANSEAEQSSTHASEAESETSDYPRSTPSPSDKSHANTAIVATPKPPSTTSQPTAKSSSTNGELQSETNTSFSKPHTKPGRTLSSDDSLLSPPIKSGVAESWPARRRVTLPSTSSSPSVTSNLKVSLVKLPTATVKAHLPDLPAAVPDDRSIDDQASTKPYNNNLSSVLDRKRSADSDAESGNKKFKTESGCESHQMFASSQKICIGSPEPFKVLPAAASAHADFSLKSEAARDKYTADLLHTQAANMKLEIAKIDSILKDIDATSRGGGGKMSSMLMFDKFNCSSPPLSIKEEKGKYLSTTDEDSRYNKYNIKVLKP